MAVSMDTKDRAQQAKDDWDIGNIPVAYGMTKDDVANWGLYLSTSIKEAELAQFAEPGLFWIKPDGTLYAWFSYHNKNKETVTIPVGPDNRSGMLKPRSSGIFLSFKVRRFSPKTAFSPVKVNAVRSASDGRNSPSMLISSGA